MDERPTVTKPNAMWDLSGPLTKLPLCLWWLSAQVLQAPASVHLKLSHNSLFFSVVELPVLSRSPEVHDHSFTDEKYTQLILHGWDPDKGDSGDGPVESYIIKACQRKCAHFKTIVLHHPKQNKWEVPALKDLCGTRGISHVERSSPNVLDRFQQLCVYMY